MMFKENNQIRVRSIKLPDTGEGQSRKKSGLNMSPIRVPKYLIEIMDQFLKAHPELGIYSRQELARRAIADWMLEKRRVLRGSNSPEYSAVIK